MSLAMFSWAIAWTNAKIVGEYLSFYNLVFFRFLLGFLSLLPFIIIKKNPFPKMVDLKYILIPSLLFFVYNIAFFKGTHYGLAGTGGVLVTTLNPLCTILIMSLINKRIIKKEVYIIRI
jgi:drug/metabolite transporter (DMT)-like permease